MEKPKRFTTDDSASGVVPGSGAESYQERWTALTVCPERSRYALLARGKRYGRWWMLKGLRPELRNDAACRLMLRKEFETMAALEHPNIVSAVSMEQVGDLGECIVMEWVDGEPLDAWLRSGPARQQRLRVARQLMDALAYLHGRQMVHRDLKPQNVMITRNGSNVKLIDFGLTDSDSSAVMKAPAGTRGYADPEQNRQANVLNDVYSLGQVLRQLHLGTACRGVVRKCCRPQRRRYRNVDAVRAAMRRAAMVPGVMALAVIAMALVCAFAFYASHRDLQQRQQMEEVRHVTQALTDSMARVQKAAAVTGTGQQRAAAAGAGRHTAASIAQPAQPAGRNMAVPGSVPDDKTIEEGKRLIDRIAGPADREYRTFKAADKNDFKEISSRQEELCFRLWDNVEAFCKKQECSDAGRALLLQVLNDYGVQKYTLPWQKHWKEQQRLLLKAQ